MVIVWMDREIARLGDEFVVATDSRPASVSIAVYCQWQGFCTNIVGAGTSQTSTEAIAIGRPDRAAIDLSAM